MALLHPRILVKRKEPLSQAKQRERAAKVQAGRRSSVWLDPFPQIYGTKPEKMVYAEFKRRGIPFQFQEWFHVDIPDLQEESWLRPDFVVLSAKLIIPIQGNYFHTRPATIEKDSLQFAMYQIMGWKVIPLWEYDIEDHLQALLDGIPELRAVEFTGDEIPHQAKWIDDLKGLRKANQKRRKPWTHKAASVKVKRKNNKKSGLFQWTP